MMLKGIRQRLKLPLVIMLAWVALLLLVATCSVSRGQDARGEQRVDTPAYRGQRANAPIPANMHIRNEGGSDGAGLCVVSSILCNGWYQGVPGLHLGKGSRLWMEAKRRPGGYSPDKLKRLLDYVMPGEKYASYLGTDTSVIDKLSSAGYPVGVTMNTAALYNYRPIHHMVSLLHYSLRDGWAMYVDNNDPGMYHIVPTREMDRRMVDGGVIWAWSWTRKPLRSHFRGDNSLTLAVVVIAAAMLASEADDDND